MHTVKDGISVPLNNPRKSVRLGNPGHLPPGWGTAEIKHGPLEPYPLQRALARINGRVFGGTYEASMGQIHGMEQTPTQPLSSESMLGSAALRILHLASLQWVFGAEPGGQSDRRFGIFAVHSGSADPGHCASLASCLSRRSAQSRGGTQSAQPGHFPADNGCSMHCVYAASRRFWDFPALSKKRSKPL